MMNSSNENVMTLEETFTAGSFEEDNATPLLASGQAVAAVNPEDEAAQASHSENTADTAPAFPSESHFETIINMDSDMPPIVDLTTAGLRRSPRISAQKADSSYSSWFTCNTIMKCVCVFGVVLASPWSPSPSKLHSHAQNLVFATVNSTPANTHHLVCVCNLASSATTDAHNARGLRPIWSEPSRAEQQMAPRRLLLISVNGAIYTR